MGAVQSLWDQEPNQWDQLPYQVQRRIYRYTDADRELLAERYANAPGGYKHWLRTSPIGPELERQVRREAYTHGVGEQGTFLMLKDIVKVITRFQNYGGNPSKPSNETLRPPVLPVEVTSHGVLYDPVRRLLHHRIRVRFNVDWSSVGAENEMSPWLYGSELTAAELGVL
jgi:hypothetical protein